METQESHPTKTRTTVSLSEECIILLDIFSEHQPRWKEDQIARFKIWSASLGVFENGHASIDYRLRDHPEVLNLVTQQLDVLRVNLEKLKSSVSEPVQSQLQKKVTSGTEFFDVEGEEFVYESPTSEASLSSTDLELEGKGYRDTKLSEGLQIVEETIARLNALSTAIRRSGKQSRTSKADLYEVIEYVDGAKINVTQEFQKYASAIVAREIPGAEIFLKERLAVSIARRRNRFLYWKRHDKMSKIYVKKVMPSGLVKELRITQQANLPQVEDQSFNNQNRMRDEGTIMTGFTATTFDAKNFRRPTESARGSIKPTGSVRWKNREEFPKPPKIGIKESHFVCPICLILSPAKEAKGDLWVQHVTRDLKPYVCVFESCETPQTVFDNFQDWISHMKKEQMAPEWYCASASHPPARFDSQGLFESHMREKHPSGFIETQLHALAQRNMRHAPQVFTCCPFCSYGQDGDHLTHASTLRNQDELQHHISGHLLSLAFISLPPLNAGDSSNSEGGESSRAALDSRIEQSEPMEHLQFGDVSHDPNTVESPIQPTSDWDWGFVRESLEKRPVTEEDSPDSVLSRLWKMQQKLASKQTFTSDDSVDHKREDSSESSPQAPLQEGSKLATMGNPGSRNETQKSTKKIDGALPSTVVEGAVPLIPRYDEVERVQRQTVEDRQKMLGPDHPETLTSLNNLAQALFFKGQYKEAAALYRQALAGREKILQSYAKTPCFYGFLAKGALFKK